MKKFYSTYIPGEILFRRKAFSASDSINMCLVSILFLLFSFSDIYGEIRYVSKTGNPVPPYTSWATASDSIQKCIDLSQAGDTIYVGDGAYAEKITMKPGISLIGSGNDNCIIDTRTLTFEGFYAVDFADQCLISDFFLRVSYTWVNDHWVGNGIRCIGGTGIIRNVKFQKGYIAIYSRNGAEILIEDNSIYTFHTGVRVSSSNSTVKNNFIHDVEHGIYSEATGSSYTPVFEKNAILNSNRTGIYVSYSFIIPTIRDNFIFLDGINADGIWAGGRDTVKIYNNLILANNASEGITCAAVPAYIYNNFLMGKFNFRGIGANSQNVVANNSVVNSVKGFVNPEGSNAVIINNNSFNNEENYSPNIQDTSNISANPMVVNDDSTQGVLDFRLQMFSPLIDAGDPALLDPDGTRSDIGLYGGPFGESYIYQDLAPRIPVNFSITVDSLNINLSWNKNTEADFLMYRVYRDTVPEFQIDSLNLISEQTDTAFIQFIPQETDGLYYKLTSVDNQMNESLPTEELSVILSSGEEAPVVITDYILYQNYPNPFNPSTNIGYKLKERGFVKLYIYDIKGEIVAELVNNIQEKGYHETRFTPSAGNTQLSSGMYIYHINVKNENNIPVFSKSGKMIFLK